MYKRNVKGELRVRTVREGRQKGSTEILSECDAEYDPSKQTMSNVGRSMKIQVPIGSQEADNAASSMARVEGDMQDLGFVPKASHVILRQRQAAQGFQQDPQGQI